MTRPLPDAREWSVGDRVRNIPKHAEIMGDGAWPEKMAKPRGGVVLEVPLATRTAGEGTLRVEWDSLTGPKLNPADWRMWVHSSLIDRED